MKFKKIIATMCAAAVLSLTGCGNNDRALDNSTVGNSTPASSSSKKPAPTSTSSKKESQPEISESTSEPAVVSEPTSEPDAASEPASEPISIPNIIDQKLLRPEVKEAIDSYEAFIDEYCDFMKKMSQTDNAGTMMLEYLEYIQKLTEMGEKFDKISDDDLTDAEVAYYTEVMLRCNQKMVKW